MHALNAEVPGCDVVVIDDGSSDNTRETLKGLARGVTLPCNLGIGGAVQTGWQIALREDYDFAMQVDGDGQHPPQEIRKLLAAMQESTLNGEPSADLVVGSRFRSEGGFKSTATRRMGIRFFALMLSAICRTKITDPTSGFRIVNRRAIRLLAQRYSEDFPEVEALVVAHRAGLRNSGSAGGDGGTQRGALEHRRDQVAGVHAESAAGDFHDAAAQAGGQFLRCSRS